METPAAEASKSWAELAEEGDAQPAEKPLGLEPDEPDAKLTVDQSNPDSPLYSVGKFEDLKLRPELLQGVYALGFNKPSKIQETALPLILGTHGRPQNVIAQSQSGTGKTAAFALGMLNQIDESRNATQCLCLCPTRELAQQLHDVITTLGKFTKIKVFLAVKDVKVAGDKPHIIVGTPGKVGDFLKRKIVVPRDIKIFVLDEADNMLDQQGLGDQTKQIHRLLPRECQFLFFSATWDDEVAEFAERIVPKPRTTIRLERSKLALSQIAQYYTQCSSDEARFQVLSDIYSSIQISQSIIFCQRKDTATWLAKKMNEAGHAVSLLHGNLETSMRDSVINDYRHGKTRVLITTNVMARGIDIRQITLVINYDIPLDRRGKPDFAIYLHRIGRSGRFGNAGIALNFVSDQKSMSDLKQIEDYFQRPIHPLPINELEKLGEMLREISIQIS